MTRYAAKGVQLQAGDGAASESFTAIAQLSMVGGIEIGPETEDVTDHDSTSDFREHVETVLAVGDIAIEGHWDPANATHSDMKTKASGGTGPHNFKIIWPDSGATTAAFAASLTIKLGDSPVDGKLPFSGSLKVSGAIAWS